MSELPILVLNTYVPKPGDGKALRAALAAYSKQWVELGHPELVLCRGLQGPHNSITTIQRWKTFAEWSWARSDAAGSEQMRDVVFKQIYPLLASSHETLMFEVLE